MAEEKIAWVGRITKFLDYCQSWTSIGMMNLFQET